MAGQVVTKVKLLSKVMKVDSFSPLCRNVRKIRLLLYYECLFFWKIAQ